jgi:hypothetical protein
MRKSQLATRLFFGTVVCVVITKAASTLRVLRGTSHVQVTRYKGTRYNGFHVIMKFQEFR